MPEASSLGRPRWWSMRDILNGIFYVLRGGIAWRLMPKDLPPKSKNSEEADSRMSAMKQVTSPRRPSGKAAQADRTPWISASSVSIRSLNHTSIHRGIHLPRSSLRIAALAWIHSSGRTMSDLTQIEAHANQASLISANRTRLQWDTNLEPRPCPTHACPCFLSLKTGFCGFPPG